jgi:hypothetical protein
MSDIVAPVMADGLFARHCVIVSSRIRGGSESNMSQNYPGGDPSYPGDPNNPQTFPQQPGQPQQYPQQPTQPGYGQPPAYGQQPGYGQEQQPPPYQPPVYNQAAQPQYPQQQPPQYPQQQKKSSKRGWIIGCSIAAVVVLLICGGIGVALYIGAQTAGNALKSTGQAALAATQFELFCTDFETQDYGSAYQLLSSGAQGRESQAQFATHQAALDTSDGMIARLTPITRCRASAVMARARPLRCRWRAATTRVWPLARSSWSTKTTSGK